MRPSEDLVFQHEIDTSIRRANDTTHIPFRLQSAQVLFSGLLTISLNVLVNFSCVALSILDIVDIRVGCE